MENEKESSLFGLSIDDRGAATLKTAAQWGKVLSILGFILGASILIFGFIIYNKLTVTYSSFENHSLATRSLQTLAIRYLIICVLLGAVFITSAIFTLNFSNRTVTGLYTADQFSFNSGLIAIRNGIIFWSIIFIIFIMLMIVIFVGLLSIG